MDELAHDLIHRGLAVGADNFEERPWGCYVDWSRADDATMKVMAILPGCRMSLQRHFERREQWYVVAGTGEDQGIEPPVPLHHGVRHTIKVEQLHRIANTGDEPLIIIEMQTGHCSEDDIERLEDDHGRA